MVTAPTHTWPAIQEFRLCPDDTVYGLFPTIMSWSQKNNGAPFFLYRDLFIVNVLYKI